MAETAEHQHHEHAGEAAEPVAHESDATHRARDDSAPPKPSKPAGGASASASAASGGHRVKQRGSADGAVADLVKKNMDKVLKVVFALQKAVELGVKAYNVASEKYDELYAKFERYNPNAVVGMFTGFILAFFGGQFIVTVAMVQAFQTAGSHILFHNLSLLSEQIKNVEQASAADDLVDDNGDGVADVLQISKDELARRKLVVAVRAMDPFVVQEALGALWTSTLSAASTVKLKFARTIALGVTIGNVLYRPVIRYLVPILEKITPPYLHKWYPSVFGYICRLIGASIAFQIQRILSTVSTALHGGHMMIDYLEDWSVSQNKLWLSEGFIDDIIAWALVGLGIYVQLFVFTSLPFLFKLLLFPFFFLESSMTALVTTV